MSHSIDPVACLEKKRTVLAGLGFSTSRHTSKVYGHFFEFQSCTTQLLLCYGPPQYEWSMTITIGQIVYEMKDLVAIPEIKSWWLANALIADKENRVEQELDWLLQLLAFALPVLDSTS